MAHLKRIISPSYWKTGKKTAYWVVTPKPGRHPKDRSLPLLVVMRDVLKLGRTAREVNAILGAKEVLVDGKACMKGSLAVGLMDTITFKTVGKHYRVVPLGKGLGLVEIPEKEALLKILKVTGKRTIGGGKTQVAFHDGRTLLLDAAAAGSVKTGFSVLFDLKSGKVAKYIPLDKRTIVVVYDGAHTGKVFEISEFRSGTANSPPTVLLEAGRKSLETLKEYVIAVGVGKPELTVSEGKKEAA